VFGSDNVAHERTDINTKDQINNGVEGDMRELTNSIKAEENTDNSTNICLLQKDDSVILASDDKQKLVIKRIKLDMEESEVLAWMSKDFFVNCKGSTDV
jgi:hypothetical protein